MLVVFVCSLMTNKLQQITTLTLAAILIAGSFSLTPFAYSTGSNYGNNNWNHDDDDDDHSNPQIGHELCKKSENLINNGCFEDPKVENTKGWDIFDVTDTTLKWEVAWKDEQPCEDFPNIAAQLELQRGILDGPAEGKQHAELDSDCNGPDGTGDGEEHTSVRISQKTKETTTESDKYTITFAYKARPGKNVDIDNNGLKVEWNGADVTPDNLKFSKKDWKYASVTVNGINGLSEVKFIDSSMKSDTLGTFLDDVSVIKVPKPTTKITLYKEFVGGSIPNGFELKINDMAVNSGEVNSYTDVEEFTITENAPNFIATFDEDCPFSEMEQTVHLVLGSVVECDILNTFVPPPTITIKKALTQDNTDEDMEVEESEFNFKIQNIEGGDPISITMDNQQVAPGTYTLIEEVPDNDIQYNFVTITGDDGCPIILDDNTEDGDEFTLSSGQHLTCVVLNDDDKDALPDGAPDGPGVIFHYDTLTVVPLDIPEDFDCTQVTERPCIHTASGSRFYIFPDFANDNSINLLTHTSLLLLTVLDTENPENNGDCRLVGVDETLQAFVSVCPSVNEIQEHNVNFNWAIIETSG